MELTNCSCLLSCRSAPGEMQVNSTNGKLPRKELAVNKNLEALACEFLIFFGGEE